MRHKWGYRGRATDFTGITNWINSNTSMVVEEKGNLRKVKRRVIAFLKEHGYKHNSNYNYNATIVQQYWNDFTVWYKEKYP